MEAGKALVGKEPDLYTEICRCSATVTDLECLISEFRNALDFPEAPPVELNTAAKLSASPNRVESRVAETLAIRNRIDGCTNVLRELLAIVMEI